MRPTLRSKIASTVGSLSKRDAQRMKSNGGGMTLPLIELPPPTLGEDERYTTRETILWCMERAVVAEFDLDVAACVESHWADRYYTKADDGLSRPWAGRVWCNPPYSDIAPWVAKAWTETRAGNAWSVAMLIPANRTEQKFWQRDVEPFRDLERGRYSPEATLTSHFLPGRTSFARPGSGGVGQSGAPFGCVLLVWRRA